MCGGQASCPLSWEKSETGIVSNHNHYDYNCDYDYNQCEDLTGLT